VRHWIWALVETNPLRRRLARHLLSRHDRALRERAGLQLARNCGVADLGSARDTGPNASHLVGVIRWAPLDRNRATIRLAGSLPPRSGFIPDPHSTLRPRRFNSPGIVCCPICTESAAPLCIDLPTDAGPALQQEPRSTPTRQSGAFANL